MKMHFVNHRLLSGLFSLGCKYLKETKWIFDHAVSCIDELHTEALELNTSKTTIVTKEFFCNYYKDGLSVSIIIDALIQSYNRFIYNWE